MDPTKSALETLIMETQQRPVSRVSFIKRALALGLSTTAVAGVLREIEGPISAAAAATQAQISFSSWGSLDEQTTILKVLKTFQNSYPNIQVSPELTSWGNYWPKYDADVAAKSTADVQFLTNVPSYAEKGALVEIRSLLKKHGKTVPKAYTPALLTYFEYNGGLYGYPRDNDTKVVFYNKTLFRKAGVPFPKNGWTYDDLRTTAMKLTVGKGSRVTQYGYAFETGQWPLYFWQSGTNIFNDPVHPTQITINTPQAVQAIQFLADLISKDKVTPPASEIADSSNITPMFASGQLAMAFGNHAVVPTYLKTTGLDWDVVGMPHFTGQPTVNVSGGAGYTISRWTSDINAAYTLWSFITGPVGSLIFAADNNIVPVSPDALRSKEWLSAPYNKVFSEQTALGHAPASFPKWPDVSNAIQPLLDKVWIGEQTAAQALPLAEAAGRKAFKS